MVGTTFVNVEDTVGRCRPEPHTIEMGPLLQKAIAEGMAAFSFPVGPIAWMGMFGPKVVVAVRPESEEDVIPFLNGLEWDCGC